MTRSMGAVVALVLGWRLGMWKSRSESPHEPAQGGRVPTWPHVAAQRIRGTVGAGERATGCQWGFLLNRPVLTGGPEDQQDSTSEPRTVSFLSRGCRA